jgi:ribonuclease P protein component
MNRLRAAEDIERVRREGKAFPHPLFVLLVAPQPDAVRAARAAVVAGRKVGVAVRRNRSKRLLREALRQMAVTPGQDLVVVARTGLAASTLSQVVGALRGGLRRAGVLAAET